MALITRSSKKNIIYDNIFTILGEGDLNKELLRKILKGYNLISKRFFCPTGRTVIYTFYDNLPIL